MNNIPAHPDPTGKTALIISHGSPSEPQAQAQALQELAEKVNALLPDWQIGSATLAIKGQLEEKMEQLGSPLLYPYFMAEGWFINTIKKKADAKGLTTLRPFGVEPALVETAVSAISKRIAELGWKMEETSLVIGAHGSALSRTSANSTWSFARHLNLQLPLADCVCGFIEQEPLLEKVKIKTVNSLCLPFFALNAGHVMDDLPEALATAGLDCPVLPSFIDWPQTPAIIADSLAAHGK